MENNSEKPMNLPQDLEQFDRVQGQTYANGAEHVYGVDKDGNKVHIKSDDVLAAYGYGPEDMPGASHESSEGVDDVIKTPTDETESQHESMFREFGADVRDESKAFMVRNPDTGRLEKKTAKELTFGEWAKATEERRAAQWYTAVRPFGEVPEGEIGDLGNGDAAEALAAREDQGQLNRREGKSDPTEDDIAYYRRLREMASSGEVPPAENDPVDPPEVIDIVPPTDIDQIELPPEMQERLGIARDRYARASATRRGLIFGRRNKKELAEAEQEYVDAIRDAGDYAQSAMESRGMTEQEIETARVLGSILELNKQVNAILEYQMQGNDGKWLGKFYDWWARQGGKLNTKAGFTGAIKKALAMALPATALGVVAGAAGFFALGPIGGAAVGAAVARAVAKGLMTSKVNNEAGARSVAGVQNAEEYGKSVERLIDISESGQQITAEDLVRGSDELTERGISRNRKRTAVALGIGAVLGATGAAVGSHFFGGGRHPSTPKATPTKVPPPSGPGHEPQYNPDIHRLVGMASDRPGAVQAFGHMVENAPKGPGNNPYLDTAYESVVSRGGGMPVDQRVVLDQVIGRLGGVEGYGNDWTAAHMGKLAELARGGMSDTEIIGEVMSGKV